MTLHIRLLGNPKLIVVDEPTAGLDPEERVRFLNLLSQIGEDGVPPYKKWLKRPTRSP